MTEKIEKEKWLTLAEVAALYGVSTQAVRYWIENGLSCKRKKVVGKKAFIVIEAKAVRDHLQLGVR
jgi:hypothetical protein